MFALCILTAFISIAALGTTMFIKHVQNNMSMPLCPFHLCTFSFPSHSLLIIVYALVLPLVEFHSTSNILPCLYNPFCESSYQHKSKIYTLSMKNYVATQYVNLTKTEETQGQI